MWSLQEKICWHEAFIARRANQATEAFVALERINNRHMAEKELELVAEKILQQDEASDGNRNVSQPTSPVSPEEVENMFKSLNQSFNAAEGDRSSMAESDSHFSTTSTDTADTTSTITAAPTQSSESADSSYCPLPTNGDIALMDSWKSDEISETEDASAMLLQKTDLKPDELSTTDQYDNFEGVYASSSYEGKDSEEKDSEGKNYEEKDSDENDIVKSTHNYDLFGQIRCPSPEEKVPERKSVTFREDVEEKFISERKCYKHLKLYNL